MCSERKVGLGALVKLVDGLLAGLDVLAEGLHLLRQNVPAFLHRLPLGAVFDGVVVDGVRSFLDLRFERAVFLL
jgi:hypothetical protein